MKLAIAGAIAVALASAAYAEPVKVKVANGSLVGDLADGVASYKGIPFAAPPVGET